MEQLQRAILMLGVSIMIFAFVGIQYEQSKYYIETRTDAEVSCFFESLCYEGVCYLNDYSTTVERLLGSLPFADIRIEEYQRAFGPGGVEYRYYISWEEILKKLEQDEIYVFLEESEIRLYIGEKVYYGQVRKRRT